MKTLVISGCLDHGLSGNKPQGYHQLRVKGRLRYVHRLAYAEHHNLEESDLPVLIRHLCNNPRCINPNHLAEGTHQDNADDRVRSNRSATSLPAKRTFTAEQDHEIKQRFAIHKANSAVAMAKEYGVGFWNIYEAIKRASK